MATKAKLIEERVAELERQVAALRAASQTAAPGFAEEGPAPLVAGEQDAKPSHLTLEQRVEKIEQDVAAPKDQLPMNAVEKDWRRAVGWAIDDPGYDEAVRLGAEWRRRENLKSIRELERRGDIDADPGHRSSQRPGSRRRTSKRATGST